jgi:hypothetical protein
MTEMLKIKPDFSVLLAGPRLAFMSLVFVTAVPAQVQNDWVMPRVSPAASVGQTVGVTQITISYHRPAVNGRVIWGGLEAYDKVWRAGANDATTITFTSNVRVDGNPLSAGVYALFVIPTTTDWTVIFNDVSRQWGAFRYDPTQDALRIKVKPDTAEHQERLEYSFPSVTDNSAQVMLRWERKKLQFTVSVDSVSLAVAKTRTIFNWEAGWFAANYFYSQRTNLDEALKWANASIALEENLSNLTLKARILAELKRHDEAIQVASRALTLTMNAPDPVKARVALEKLIAEWKTRRERKDH